MYTIDNRKIEKQVKWEDKCGVQKSTSLDASSFAAERGGRGAGPNDYSSTMWCESQGNGTHERAAVEGLLHERRAIRPHAMTGFFLYKTESFIALRDNFSNSISDNAACYHVLPVREGQVTFRLGWHRCPIIQLMRVMLTGSDYRDSFYTAYTQTGTWNYKI